MDAERMIHVGITVGPIYATLLRTATPGGMWFASTMFSKVSEMLCSELVEAGIPEEAIYAPYFSRSGKDSLPQGVGLYHDHILFLAPESFQEITAACIRRVKDRMAGYFRSSLPSLPGFDTPGSYERFMAEYLQIHYVCIPTAEAKKNPVKELNAALSTLELQEGYLYDTDDTALSVMLDGSTKGDDSERNDAARNRNIKQSFLMRRDPSKPYDAVHNAIHPQILKEQEDDEQTPELYNVLDIAMQDDESYKSDGTRMTLPVEKHRRYLALVKADGDKMGRALSSLAGIQEVRMFSKCCLRFGEQAAAEIKNCGGVTIYAGGDDLLFLAPTFNILRLCEKIDELFHQSFDDFFDNFMDKQKKKPASLSFGVQICFYRYPLYESLSQAGDLLDEAKDKGGARVALSLQKASGKEIRWVLQHQGTGKAMKQLLVFLERYTSKGGTDQETCGVWLQSVLYLTARYRSLFLLALQEDISMETVFRNLFSKGDRRPLVSELFLKDAAALLHEVIAECGGAAAQAETVLDQYDALLRFARFYLEMGVDEE